MQNCEISTMKEERRGDLRLLMLTDGLAPFVPGGMQQHSLMLAKHLAPLVQSICLLHCGKTNGNVPSSSEVLIELGNPRNVEVIGFPFEDRGKMPGHYLRASRRLSQKYLRTVGDLSQFDAIYAQGLTGDAFLGRHPKTMVNLHGLNMFQKSFSLEERIQKKLLRPVFRKQIRGAWRNVSLGGELSKILLDQGAVPESIVEIPNGIEEKWILTDEERQAKMKRRCDSSFRFVMVGRNDFVKGLHVLREALKILDKPIELHMIGDWPEWDPGIHDVTFHGIIRDKKVLMNRLDECDVLLVPSLTEGMPTVILEAVARGLSVIASDVGAVSDVISESLCPANDAIALSKELRESQLTASLNRVRIDDYTWSNIASQTLSLCRT